MAEPDRNTLSRLTGRPDLRRAPQGPAHGLVLTELSRAAVFDRGHGVVPEGVQANGSVRETCPQCDKHLKLVLRQDAVRLAHLFCDQCGACFDAHYPDGRCALTI